MTRAMKLLEINRLRESGKPEHALNEVKERLKHLTPSDGELWRSMMHLGSDCLLDMKHWELAKEWLSVMLDSVKDPVALANRGCAKWMMGDAAGALRDYLDALPLYPATEDIEVSLRQAAQLSLEVGDPLDALKYLNECERRYSKSRKTRDIRRRIENYCAT